MKEYDLREIINEMMKNAPPLMTRKQVQQFTGGLIKARTLGNRDSSGCGIVPKYNMSGNVVYPREAVIEYLLRQFDTL